MSYENKEVVKLHIYKGRECLAVTFPFAGALEENMHLSDHLLYLQF